MSLAIITKRSPQVASGGGDSSPQSAIEQIAKLIPAEVIAIYTGALAIFDGPADEGPRLYVLIAALVATPLVLLADSALTKVVAPLGQYVLRTIAFVLWADSTTHVASKALSWDPRITSVVLLFYVPLAPRLLSLLDAVQGARFRGK